MKESYGEGVATHADPESCGVVCKDRVEALAGARAGRVLSRERTFLRDADAVGESGRLHQRRCTAALRRPLLRARSLPLLLGSILSTNGPSDNPGTVHPRGV